MQLQQTYADLQRRGIGLVAVSYDPPATLKSFADRHGITFPMLSDSGSATIRKYGILNTEATGRTAGIPYPGTFVLDAKGVVRERAFEANYQERASAASLAARTTRPAAQTGEPVETRHLIVTTSVSDRVVAPGTRFSLLADVTPKAKMHVYSPEQHDYIPIALTLDEDPAFKSHPAIFPKPETEYFKPLDETQLVYSKPFRIVQDVTIALTPAMRERARTAGATLTIKGTLKYQACDDAICYLPVNVPLAWTVTLKPLER